jgi:hypothetical protein
MSRSILKNPKLKQEASIQIGAREGIITALWRKRIIDFYKSIIPSHIDESRQVWLTTPQEIVDFSEKLKDVEYDMSSLEYVCIVETIADIYDIIDFFTRLNNKLPDNTKILYSNFNWAWAPLFRIAGILGFTRNRTFGNFVRDEDLNCFLDMSGWENVKRMKRYILPIKLPLLSTFFDNFLVRLPIFKNLAVNTFFIARKRSEGKAEDHSVTVMIPCKNEEDNIEAAVKRMPSFGKSIEILFINDKSTDRTEEEILRCQKEYHEKKIVLAQGKGIGKGEAVRDGIKKATGDICIILDADLTVIPEDLPQFYEAINSRRADFVHGTRFVYAQEKGAMRFANIIGNNLFSIIFSYFLEQRTTDTLCGTKVFWRKDWPIFEEMKEILKNSDLWGDYNLIFGASRFGLKVSQLPVRYFERLEGITKMNKRIKNGLIMLRISWHALWSVKFVN